MEKQAGTMSNQSYINDMLNMDNELEYLKKEPSEISQFYQGLNILITGGSGFLGRLLIEKLLRSCPKVGKIYILMRAKKGQTAEQRLAKQFDDIIYERLKQNRPNFSKHVVLVEGDTNLKDLGLSTKARDMLVENVNIVFHSAAAVRFDESIYDAVVTNVRGTELILLLAKEMKNLKGFIHISTAFSNCVYNHIEEKFYEPPVDLDKIISLVDLLDKDVFEILKNKLLKNWPNTYVFSKALGEKVVQKYSCCIPICVVRPSIMTTTYKEPICGWINNYFGTVGLTATVGLGLLRCMQAKKSTVAELIPADYVINNIIAAGWDLMKRRKADQATFVNSLIFNVVSSAQKPITWGELAILFKYHLKDVPSSLAMWHIILLVTKRRWLYDILSMFMHTIPAAIVDASAVLIGKKPILMNIYKKINTYVDTVFYFGITGWQFDNNNVLNLWSRMSSSDKEIFYFDFNKFDWDDYMAYYTRGIRLYIWKDPFSTIPAGKVKQRRLKYAHYALSTVLLLVLGWTIFSLLCLLLS